VLDKPSAVNGSAVAGAGGEGDEGGKCGRPDARGGGRGGGGKFLEFRTASAVKHGRCQAVWHRGVIAPMLLLLLLTTHRMPVVTPMLLLSLWDPIFGSAC